MFGTRKSVVSWDQRQFAKCSSHYSYCLYSSVCIRDTLGDLFSSKVTIFVLSPHVKFANGLATYMSKYE